jgi:tetratricopeptide (TPR) repeat protein
MTRKDWQEKGKKCMEEGQHEKAIEYFDRIINANLDENGYVHHLKGSSLVELGRHEDAVECFKKALKIDPDFDTCAFDLGCSLYELGRWEEARAAFQWAIDHHLVYGVDRKASEWLARIDKETGLAPRRATPLASPETKAASKMETCKGCGQLIKSTDWTCPHCGYTQWQMIIVSGIISLICLIVAVFTSDCIRWGAAAMGALVFYVTIDQVVKAIKTPKTYKK